MLGGIQLIVNKTPDVLKEAVLGPEEVNPGEQGEDEVAFSVVCMLIHVQS